MKTELKLTRRDFLKTAGAGLAVAVVSTSTGYRLLSAAEMKKAQAFQPSVWSASFPTAA